MRENPETDLLSHLLALAHARSALSGRLLAGGAWAAAFEAGDRVRFWGVRRGAATLDLGAGAPLPIEAGDVLLFRAVGPHVLTGTPGAVPVALASMVEGRAGPTLRLGSGEDFDMIGGKVELDDGVEPLLFGGLPPLLRLAGNDPRAQPIHWIMERLVAERAAPRAGTDAACAQLAQLMLIEILRAHGDDAARLGSGYFRAVTDRRLAPALRRMHDRPGHDWRLPELAAACAMSRAGFAACFREVAGTSPLRYLAELRMRLARRRLDEGASIAKLAQEFGYASESAFSHAFKRVLGRAPAHLRGG